LNPQIYTFFRTSGTVWYGYKDPQQNHTRKKSPCS
jgi:hypothetical protein